jgi:hypothetical protein
MSSPSGTSPKGLSTNNDNEWPIESDISKLKIKKGIYTIDRSKADGSYVLLYGGLDFSEDFTIEAKMRKTKGDQDISDRHNLTTIPAALH